MTSASGPPSHIQLHIVGTGTYHSYTQRALNQQGVEKRGANLHWLAPGNLIVTQPLST